MKLGAVLSYILIIINSLYGIILTPFIISKIGDASYGVYKTISAFTNALMILDLGLGGTMMRYVSRFRADNEDDKIPNFTAMGYIQALALSAVSIAVSVALYFSLDVIYENGLTASELQKAKQLYIFLALGIVAHIFENLINGIICGYNKFIVANGVKIIRLIFRITAVVITLNIFSDPLALVLIDLASTLLLLTFEFFYLRFVLKVQAHLVKWDKRLFSESFKYTLLLFLTSIVGQINSNFASISIGAVISSTAVTVYSMALLIFAMYEQLSTAISGVMLPTITNTLKGDHEYKNTVSIVCKAGRIQFLLLGAVFAGFAVLGRQFIELWLGNGYEDVYFLTLILLGPALLELCINVCLSILRAENKLGFRTLVITLSTVANAAITLIGLFYIGYYAAAIGTAFSFLFGSVIVMGIYYYKKMKINILNLYKNIFKGTWLCILLSATTCFGVSRLFSGNMMQFVFGFVAFVIVYGATLLLFGLNNEEKNIIFSKLRRNKNG